MPYNSKNDLPDKVKNNLPDHAQDIYLKAFNNAYDEYKNPKDRYSSDSREATAHKVAWAAVEKKYTKDSNTGKWKEK